AGGRRATGSPNRLNLLPRKAAWMARLRGGDGGTHPSRSPARRQLRRARPRRAGRVVVFGGTADKDLRPHGAGAPRLLAAAVSARRQGPLQQLFGRRRDYVRVQLERRLRSEKSSRARRLARRGTSP